jgi:hypothetical protein
MDVDPSQLRVAIEGLHRCSAQLEGVERVAEKFGDQLVWEGAVHVFDLTGHPTAARAYAWSSPTEDDGKRRFVAVLHAPPITSATDAVRAPLFRSIERPRGVLINIRTPRTMAGRSHRASAMFPSGSSCRSRGMASLWIPSRGKRESMARPCSGQRWS